jgi:predicted porin
MAAFADATLVGTIDAGLMNYKAAGSSSGTTSFSAGGMTTSYFGFEGSEDLGNGSSAIYELTSFINNADGSVASTNLFSRSAFVGLKGAYGQLTLGRQANPSFLPVVLFNAYGDSAGFGPLWHQTYFNFNGGNFNGQNNVVPSTQIYNDTAWDNAVAYTLPEINGLTATVMTAKGSTGGVNSGANVLYFHGDLAATVYWQSTQFASSNGVNFNATPNNLFANNQSATAAGAGLSYDLKTAKVFATYQDARDSSISNMEGKTTQVSALIPAGKGNVMAEYATTKYTATGVNSTYSEWAAGYDYNLSKKTDAYVTFGQSSVTGMSNGQTYGAGLRVRF